MTNDELKNLIIEQIENAKEIDYVWSNEKDDEVPVIELRVSVAAHNIIELLINLNIIPKT